MPIPFDLPRPKTQLNNSNRLVCISQSLGGEVVNPSMLERYPWPTSDPQLVQQQTRPINDQVRELIYQAARADKFNPQSFEKQAKNRSLEEIVFYLLTDSKYNFNGTTEIRSEDYWFNRVANAVQVGEPINVVYPLFCKVLNWAKQMTASGVTAGEESTILFLQRIDEQVRTIL